MNSNESTIKEKYIKAKMVVDKHNQQHLLAFYDELQLNAQEELLDEILNIDFELIEALYKDSKNTDFEKGSYDDIKPINVQKLEEYSKEERAEFTAKGMELLKEGKVAVLLVAGGQGTRLGHNGPKGTYNIGLPSGKSLFQLQCEQLINLSKRINRFITWYIMTSSENNRDTVSFFEENNYFGYPKEHIVFFQQDVLPIIDTTGKILLSGKGNIVSGPNGNGGCFLALEKAGVIARMKREGIQWMFQYGIDNSLSKVADPMFIGFTAMSGLQASSKVVRKKYPEESVGVFCYNNGRPMVIEYSELPEALRYKLDEKGELAFSSANIINHIFSVDFLEKIAEVKLPYHVAFKKIKHINDEGNEVIPASPNAYKFELFMFDIFPRLDDMAALEVTREEQFAPVKNKEGSDSPLTARNLILELHKKWLVNAGIAPELLNNKVVEISPLTSYSGENLNCDEIKDIIASDLREGCTITL